jgi:hypothetical protein
MFLIISFAIIFWGAKSLIKKKPILPQTPKHGQKPSTGIAVASLIINLMVLPGLGSIIGGKKKEGIWQLAIALGGFILGFMFILTIVGIFLGFFLIFLSAAVAWIWALITSIQIIKESA